MWDITDTINEVCELVKINPYSVIGMRTLYVDNNPNPPKAIGIVLEHYTDDGKTMYTVRIYDDRDICREFMIEDKRNDIISCITALQDLNIDTSIISQILKYIMYSQTAM